jgi:amylovoran biosynthesis glycosyltransferase AmsB
MEDTAKKRPTVSVIIPVYNASGIVHVALNSLLSQNLRDFEVIIVDDCSADHAKLHSVLSSPKYVGLNLRLRRLDKNSGQEVATSVGVELAESEFVALLDSDDEWHPDKLLVCRERLKELERQHSGRWIVHSRSLICRDDRTIKIMPSRPLANNETVAEYLFGPCGWMQTSSLVLRTEDARRIGFFRMQTNYRGKGDYEFCIRASRNGYLFHLIEQPLVAYRSWSDATAVGKGDTTSNERSWLRVMRPQLNFRDRCTFRAFLLARKIRIEKGALAAAMVFVVNVPFTSWRNKKGFLELIWSKLFHDRHGIVAPREDWKSKLTAR